MYSKVYPRAESPEWAAVFLDEVVFSGVGDVEAMAAGTRSEVEMFCSVDPVGSVGGISRWFQYIGSVS